ncbi:MAG: tRNA uridine-5-carboxymethylaminomethyl(34) synthesis GTPase MnmE [Candidatus Aminicenantes bacterium]|nr:MAG: tRNA uridine-5-carboxymethylaminomethyl(34) synthesis GTPase MnmE [Candidatus Aminicenantes bacterium]
MLEDTIIAISTPVGYGGIGIVRLSGDRSLPIAKKIFKPRKKNTEISALRSILGNLYHFEQKDFFEEAYLTYFPKPFTYTREDMVEISCHGSPVTLEEVVRLGIKAGARMANPGEFTLRAYFRGRIDILQAEAINDLIQASSFKQAKISYNQIEGKLSQRTASFRSQIIQLLSLIEASIEFPEENLHLSRKKMSKTIEKVIDSIKRLVESYSLGKTLAEGTTLAITGRANVGKSTLFNSLLERERAIISHYPGTTRDYLKESIRIKDSIFTLIDMAGIDKPVHPADKEAIKKGRELAAHSDGILLLFDSSRKESLEDLKLINKFKDKKMLFLFNKIDLPQKINKSKLKREGKNHPFLEISALKGTNLEKLKGILHQLFVPDQRQGEEVILHLRQKLLFEEVLESLLEGKRLLEEGYSEEVIAEEIRKALPLIGKLTGEIRADEVIKEIFNRFCVGK